MFKALSTAFILTVYTIQLLDAVPRMTYDHQTILTSSIHDNNFGYIGQPLNHTTTGMMIMGGYRAYNPNVGTFLKQDSYSAFQGEGTFNGFDYAAGNPIISVDPTGHDRSLRQWFDIGLTIFFSVVVIIVLGFLICTCCCCRVDPE